MKGKEALTKEKAIEALEKASSSYFGESFDLCKKQIELLHPHLEIIYDVVSVHFEQESVYFVNYKWIQTKE